MTEKEQHDKFFAKDQEKTKKIRNKSTPEEQERFDAVFKAQKLLNDAGVQYWLFPELPCGDGYDVFNVIYNVNRFYKPDGSVDPVSYEFSQNHYGGLAATTCSIFNDLYSNSVESRSKDDPIDILGAFSLATSYAIKEYNRRQEISPNFK